MSWSPCHYSSFLPYLYFIGSGAVVIVLCNVPCVQGLQSSFWTAAVDPVGISVCSFRVLLYFIVFVSCLTFYSDYHDYKIRVICWLPVKFLVSPCWTILLQDLEVLACGSLSYLQGSLICIFFSNEAFYMVLFTILMYAPPDHSSGVCIITINCDLCSAFGKTSWIYLK